MAAYEIVERDEAGRVMKTYVGNGDGRVDVITPKDTKSYAQQVLDVFLPAGYPQSDSLQAFSSSIAGMLSSRAVLEGKNLSHPLVVSTSSTLHQRVGVGDSSASPTAALLLSVLQESMGRIATILFAHRLGTALEPECKMYRLAADVLNDTAMILDCLSPAFPKPARVLLLSFSSVLRSLCGVCAGSAKAHIADFVYPGPQASLSAHFAKKGNLGELNAVTATLTCIVEGFKPRNGHIAARHVVLIALLSIHLATNYAAVKAVSMRCLNRQRANIVFSALQQHGSVLSPLEVSVRERIFERDGVLRWNDGTIIGSCRIGVPLEILLRHLGRQHRQTGSLELQHIKLQALLNIFADEAYLLWFVTSKCEALIVLKEGCTPTDQLKAWAHALLLAHQVQHHSLEHKLENDDTESADPQLTALRSTLEDTKRIFVVHAAVLEEQGWDLSIAAMETRAGSRAHIQ
ncbi:vitamin B6 photo-protection and homoeostasis-domain-containing protein [Phaeosphaeria sp. MPI-PUGE-AT-0046c]|nr:vitamin B6 photo-protection and homoeostasis-domain-containing protein [Phaeosphaeria sp. MPI-PUGE-AT-0046c]